jgi:hypothetical protein
MGITGRSPIPGGTAKTLSTKAAAIEPRINPRREKFIRITLLCKSILTHEIISEKIGLVIDVNQRSAWRVACGFPQPFMTEIFFESLATARRAARKSFSRLAAC